MGDTKQNKFIGIASDTIASITSAIAGMVVAGPVGAIGGAAVGPTLSAGIKEFAQRLLSSNESKRIETTFLYAAEKIKTNIENGQRPRNDSFFTAQDGHRSSAQALLEGTLLKSRDEYEEKKLVYYSNFLANITFDGTVSFEEANTLLRLIEQLSYRQLAILAYLSNGTIVNMNNWDVAFKDNAALKEYFDFYSEMTSLYNLRLLQQAGQGLKLGSAESRISTLGNTLSQLMELPSIADIEKDSIRNTINSIQTIAI